MKSEFTKNVAETAALYNEETNIVFRAESFANTVNEFLKVGKGLLIVAHIPALGNFYSAKVVDLPEGY